MRAALLVCVLLIASCAQSQPSSPRAQLKSGGIVEYKVPNSLPSGASCFRCGQASLGGIAAGADGNLWFVDSGQDKVGRITQSGAITEFDLPSDVGGPYGIGAGPDGNIWLTTSALGQGRPDSILKVRTDGTVTAFQAGNGTGQSGTGPEHITAGPDGNLWFTEFWTNRIGRMTPSGTLTEFPIPTPDSAPRGIVSGPDHALWFVESGFNRTAIARITTSGVVTEFPIGGNSLDQLQPTEIVAAPDGNLWFNQTRPSAPQGEVGRMSPNGAFTLFRFPKGSRPVGMAVGPDGNVWVTDPGGNTITRMSPNGAFRQFALSRLNAQPLGITSGRDGHLWFTEGGAIASIGVRVPEAKLSARQFTFASTSSARTLAISNTGEAPLHISSISLVGPDRSEFRKVSDACADRALPVNATCRIDVAFNPTGASGVLAARLAITDDATGSPQSVSLVAQLPGCKLPLFSITPSSSKGEFLSLPDGQITVDPNGGFETSGVVSRSQAQPVLTGTLPAVYDRAAARWVPTGTGALAPDGLRYVYTDYTQRPNGGFTLHVVDIGSGRDRTLNLPTNAWSALAFTADGIYAHPAYEGGGPGLSLIDPDSGAQRTLFTDSSVMAVSGQTAWIGTFNQSDPLPQPPGEGGGYNEVQGRDLKTGAITTWLYRSGTNLGVVQAAGAPILMSGYDASGRYLWAVGTPGKADVITDPATDVEFAYAAAFPAQPDGWWLSTAGGIYLWTPRTGAVLIADVDATPAGACA
jgi:virginiamycin B lyase